MLALAFKSRCNPQLKLKLGFEITFKLLPKFEPELDLELKYKFKPEPSFKLKLKHEFFFEHKLQL